jgi:hypothetical protein
MRDYILEKVENSTRYFRFGGIDVIEVDPVPEGIDLQAIFHSLEKLFPARYFKDLKEVRIEHIPEFDQRSTNAMYRDGVFYITNQQDDAKDIIDDVIHEFAHHLEMLYPTEIYSDENLKKEFLKKRAQLEFELRSEGYWTKEYDFRDLKFDNDFDIFLYKRVGKQMLRMTTANIFIRPYAAVSLREYFATGFEAYYMGNKDLLKQLSPVLYNKIERL